MTRLILDASILLSAVVAKPESHPSLLLDAVRSGEIEMVACPPLLREVRKGLAGPLLPRQAHGRGAGCDPSDARSAGLHGPDPDSPPRVLGDRSDDYLVALAQAAGTEAIVTGDRDLLDHEGLDPPALRARQACLQLGLIER